MANWKKLIYSGSDAHLNNITASNATIADKVGIGTMVPGSSLPDSFFATDPKLLELKGHTTSTDTGIFLRRSDNNVGADFWVDQGNAKIYIDSRYNSSAGQIRFRTRTTGTPITAMAISGDGEVGIGTTTPGEKLEVAGNVKLSGSAATHKLITYHTDGEYGTFAGYGMEFTRGEVYLRPLTNLGGNLNIGYSGSNEWANVEVDATQFKILRSGVERVMVDSSGRVGIGTATPSSKLHISTSGAISTFKAYQDTYQQFELKYDDTYHSTMMFGHFGELQYDGNGGYLRLSNKSNQAGSHIAFATSGSRERMRITHDGKVGIGNSAPSKALTVEGDISASGDLYVRHAYVSGTLGIEGFPNVSASLAAVVSQDDATTAATASTIHITNADDTTNTAHYLTMTDNIGSGEQLHADTSLQWNPSQSRLIVQQTDATKEASVEIFGATGQGSGKLYIGETINVGGGIIYQGDQTPALISGSPGTDYVGFYRRNSGVDRFVAGYKNDSDNFYFSGSVGIGTTSPTYKLDVETDEPGIVASFVSTDNKAAIQIADHDTIGYVSAENGRIAIGPVPGTHVNNINILTSSYNVGIGTQSPTKALTVHGDISSSGHLYLQPQNKLYLGSPNTYIHESSDGVIDFYGDDVQLFTVKQNGTQNEVIVNEGSGDVDFRVESNNDQYALFVQASNNNVGIGTNLPDEKLDIYGNLAINNHKVLDLSNNNLTRGPFNPIVAAIQNSGKCLALDTDFTDGLNGVEVYNNGNAPAAVTVERLKWNLDVGTGDFDATGFNWADVIFTGNADGYGETNLHSLGVPNSSGYVIKIAYNSNLGGSDASVSPELGGFRQFYINPNDGSINTQMNHTYVQIFKAWIPPGYELTDHEFELGADKTNYWLTNTTGTGKWEWYARVNHVGSSPVEYTAAGHVALKQTGGNQYNSDYRFFLASCTVYDVTEADAFTHRQIGIGTISPGSELEVIGDISASGTIESNIISASHLHIDDDLLVEGDIGIGGAIFGLSGFGVTIDDVAVTSGSTNFGSGSNPANTFHQFTGSVSITGSDLSWNGETVLTSAELHWTDTGTEITSSKPVGISGSLQVLGDITASSLSIIPSTQGELIHFGFSSSLAEGDVWHFFPSLMFGALGTAHIGRKDNTDSGIPLNGIALDNSDQVILGNIAAPAKNQIKIQNAETNNTKLQFQSPNHVFLSHTNQTLLQITESISKFSTDVQITGDVRITGSLYVSESVAAKSFTGSLLGNVEGTASRAVSASYADHVDVFPFTGNAVITGSLEFADHQLPLNDLTFNDTSIVTNTTFDAYAYRAFDSDTNGRLQWTNAESQLSPSVTYNVRAKLGYSPVVSAYAIQFQDTDGIHSRIRIEGSNDDATYHKIHFDEDGAYDFTNTYRKVTCNGVKRPYAYIRMTFPSGYQNSDIDIKEIHYFSDGYIKADTFVGTGSYSLFAESASYASNSNNSNVATFAENSAQWFDSGNELTSSVNVGISGSLRVHGHITASSLSIVPAGAEVIEFAASSSEADGIFTTVGILNFAGSNAYIGHKNNLNPFTGITNNGITFNAADDALSLGGTSYISIKNGTSAAGASMQLRGYHDLLIGTNADANIMFITESYAKISDARITGSLHGNVYGTGSWAYNAVSASWAPGTENQWYEDSTYISSSKKVKIENELHVYSSGDTATDPLEGHLLRVTNTGNDNPNIEHWFAENADLKYGFRWKMTGQTDNDFKLYRHDNSSGGSEVLRVQRGSDNIRFNGAIHSLGGSYTDAGTTWTNVGLILDHKVGAGDYIYTRNMDANTEGTTEYLRKLLGVTSNVIQIGQSGTSYISEIRHIPGGPGGFTSFYSGSHASDDVRIARFQGNDLYIDSMTETTTHADANKAVVYNTSTGQLMYTGSYGSGGGTGDPGVSSYDDLTDVPSGIVSGAAQLTDMQDFTIPEYITHLSDPDTKFGFPTANTFDVITAGNLGLRVNSTGDLHIKNDIIGFSTTVSDKRLKTDIQLLTGSLDTICNLEGVRYNWKYRNDTPQLGVIAQQVEQYVPEIVKEMELPLHATDDAKYKTVQYEQLIPHLIESIKELRSELEEVKRQLKE